MACENFDIANWKIENFSCWTQALHGKCILSPAIYFVDREFEMQLFPRGTSGQEDHMVVHISLSEKEFTGDLSFIGADGSTLCTRRVNSKYGRYLELPPGPKFEEVIIKSTENESDSKDQLTLLFKMKSDWNDEHHVRTIIQIFDVTMEVDPSKMFKDNGFISSIRYVQDSYETELYLKTCKKREDDKMELYLEPATKDAFSVKTHLRLISCDGSLLRYENNEHLFQEKESWAFSESLAKKNLSENRISIILHIKIISGNINQTLKNVYFFSYEDKITSNRYVSVSEGKSLKTQDHNDDQENASVGVLLKDLMCLYQYQDFSDLQLKCEGVSFPVHRNILSARSTVFKTMLSTDMTKAVLDIEDLDPSTLSLFLAFLYTGEVEDLQGESALKLYYAADKYHVPSLKKECVGFLRANVSVSNVCDVLSIGNKHHDEKLTAAAHDIILRNYNEVLKSKEWNSFKCSEPILAVDTLTTFAAKDFVGNLNPL